MAKSQWPLDGKPGKAWKVTSPFGWRQHPIKKTKKHHNGTDIWQGGANSYLEAWTDGKVVAVYRTTNPNSSGNRIDVQSTVMGKKITWTYFHMVDGSIKVKKGQRITAGTVVGKMGATGFATGKHLHWEIWAGHRKAQPNINSGGRGFYDPMQFAKAVLAWEQANAAAPEATPDDAPVTVLPAHSNPDPVPPVAAPKPVAAPVVSPGVTKALPILKKGSKGVAVKHLQTLLHITADGDYGPKTLAAVKTYQAKNGLAADGVVGPATWDKLGKK
jgi:murein DD-endopeptidase MepM/ murein hydrolase activator NlpD